MNVKSIVQYNWSQHQKDNHSMKVHALEQKVLKLDLIKTHLWFPTTLQRGAFCQFPFRWIYYCLSSKSTGKETDKTHICSLVGTILICKTQYNCDDSDVFLKPLNSRLVHILSKNCLNQCKFRECAFCKCSLIQTSL